MSKNVKIIITVACFVLAGVIYGFSSGIFSGSGSVGSDDGKMWFQCVNPDCNQSYSLTPDEFTKSQGDNPMMMMPMMVPGQPQAFKCVKCGQQSAYMAQQCEKCKAIFIMQMPALGQANQDFPDRCPKCGYSAMEEAEKQTK